MNSEENYEDIHIVDPVQETIRTKRDLQSDGTCRGRIIYFFALVIKFIFQLQDLLGYFFIVLSTAAISLAMTVSTQDEHLAMLYAVMGGSIFALVIYLLKVMIRRFTHRVWVDVEVDGANFALLSLIVVLLSISITGIILIDKNCTKSKDLCNLNNIFF